MRLSRRMLYVLVSASFILLFTAYVVFFVLTRSKTQDIVQEGFAAESMGDTTLNVLIVRSFSKVLQRFPSSGELHEVRKWIKSDVDPLLDRNGVKEAVDAHLKRQWAGGDDAVKTREGGDTAVAVEKPVETSSTDEAVAGSPAPFQNLVPSYAPASFAENFVGSYVNVDISQTDVDAARSKVSTVLQSLDSAKDAMKSVADDANQKLSIPIELDAIRKLREQMSSMSEKLQAIENTAAKNTEK
jgi:hypothetical protein